MLNPLPLQVHDDGPGFHLGFPALDPPDRRILNDTGMTEAAWTHVTAPRFRWPSALLAMVQALAEPRNSVRRTYSRG